MHYFAGMFDAEGWVSLTNRGNFIIGVQLTHKPTTEAFHERFGGKLYMPRKKDKKQIYSWMIPTNTEQAKNFIKEIAPLCHLKNKQLILLGEYLNQTRTDKKETRARYITEIAALKKPTVYKRSDLIFEPTIKPDEPFFKWLAGFMDGDGYMGVYEYQNYSQRSFDSVISLFNIHAPLIEFIQKRIKGSVTCSTKQKNPVWTWNCNQASSLFLCKSIEPYVVIKKQHCRLIAQYLAIHATKKYGVPYDEATVSEIREIIKQIKHFNSL